MCARLFGLYVCVCAFYVTTSPAQLIVIDQHRRHVSTRHFVRDIIITSELVLACAVVLAT